LRPKTLAAQPAPVYNSAMSNPSSIFWRKTVDHARSFEILYDQLQDIFFFAKDLKGRLVYANDALVKHYGVESLDGIIGKTDYEIHFHYIAEKIVRDDKKVMQTKKPILNIIELFPDRGGTPQWYLTNKSPLFDNKNNLCGICGTVQSYEKSREQITPYILLTPAIDYMRENFRESIKITDLPKLTDLSLRQFNRRFKDFFNTTPLGYLTHIRILESCNLLLKTRQSVTEIALGCGFYDHSHFIREFKKEMTLTPHAYRVKYEEIKVE